MATSFKPIFTPSLMLFRETMLRGRGHPIDRSRPSHKNNFYEVVESFLINGKKPWRIVNSEGKIYCLKPVPDPAYKFPTCVIFDASMNDVRTDVQAVYKGCAGDKGEIVVELNNCAEFGGKDFGFEKERKWIEVLLVGLQR
jgi:hypothetical protein